MLPRIELTAHVDWTWVSASRVIDAQGSDVVEDCCQHDHAVPDVVRGALKVKDLLDSRNAPGTIVQGFIGSR